MPQEPKPFNPGDQIDADSLNALIGFALSGKLHVQAPLYAQTFPDGVAIGCDLPETFVAEITGGTNPYDFVEQIQSGGGWVDGPRASTVAFKAYELNGNATIPAGTRVRLYRATDRWWFQMGLCT